MRLPIYYDVLLLLLSNLLHPSLPGTHVKEPLKRDKLSAVVEEILGQECRMQPLNWDTVHVCPRGHVSAVFWKVWFYLCFLSWSTSSCRLSILSPNSCLKSRLASRARSLSLSACLDLVWGEQVNRNSKQKLNEDVKKIKRNTHTHKRWLKTEL